MQRKILNLLEIVLTIILLIFLCTATYTNISYNPEFTWAIEKEFNIGNYTYLDYALSVDFKYLSLPLFLMIFINFISTIVSLFSKTEKISKIHTLVDSLLPIFTVIVGLMAFRCIGVGAAGYTGTPSPTFRIIAILMLILIAILGVLKAKFFKQNTATTIINETQVEISNADELKKYKDLLDSGVITQEEFDSKKEQLLGL